MPENYKNILITSVENWSDFEIALKSDRKYILLVAPSVLTINKFIYEAEKYGKKLFIHFDMTDGLGKDRDGLELVARSGVHGIVTTRASIAKLAKSAGLAVIHSFFIIDRKSVKTALETVSSSQPDMILLLPSSVVYDVIDAFKEFNIPILCGGFIDSHEKISNFFDAGVSGCFTSSKDLW